MTDLWKGLQLLKNLQILDETLSQIATSNEDQAGFLVSYGVGIVLRMRHEDMISEDDARARMRGLLRAFMRAFPNSESLSPEFRSGG